MKMGFLLLAKEMSMTWILVKKEILQGILSEKFILTVALCLILVPTSFYLLGMDYQKRLANYTANQSRNRELFSGQVYNYPGGGWYSDFAGEQKIIIRPTILSIFAKGLSERMSRPVRFNYAAQIQYDDIQERNLLFFLFTPPDFVSIVKVILSLLCMLSVFDSISGEKESGTLKLLLSQPVPRHTILLGKWLGGYITILFPFLMALIVGLLALRILSFISFDGGEWIQVGIIMLLSLLYISIFFSLGLFVSARTRKASTSVLVSLLVWVMLVLVIPNLGNLIAKEIWPIPSRMKVEAMKHETARELEDNASRQGKRADTDYGGYGSAHFEIWPEVRRACQSLEEEYRARSDKLTRLAKGIARISPASSFTFSTMALARAGIRDERRYEHALSRHIDEFARVRFAEGHKSPPFWGWRTSREVNFTYEERSLRESLYGVLMDVFLLAFFAVLFFMGAYVSFLRYDPT